MKRTEKVKAWTAGVLAACVLMLAFACRVQAQTALYSTGFEVSEDYLPDLTLTGQKGWVGSGADGLVTNFFADLGQQAYIGFAPPPEDTNDFHSVFLPLNLPASSTQSILKFSVLMQVVDSTSTNGPWDDFRWSVYNTNGNRLFSINFDNASLLVSYVLDGSPDFVPADVKFDTLGNYDLVIAMNFARNLWTATLNDEVIINAKPITTIGSPLNLGDIDAVWAIRDPAHPGDNFMLFDNYTVTAESASSIPPKLEPLGVLAGGAYSARLYGEPGLVYRVEMSADLVHWQPLLTFTAPPGGILDFQDSSAPGSIYKFYRARQAQ